MTEPGDIKLDILTLAETDELHDLEKEEQLISLLYSEKLAGLDLDLPPVPPR